MDQTDERDEIETPEAATIIDTETEGDGIAQIAADFIVNMPEVSQHAVDAHTAKETATQNAPKTVDKNGSIFDPTIHAVNADGSPALTKTGLYARKRGRKAGVSTLGNVPGNLQTGKAPPVAGEPQKVPTGVQKVSPMVMGAGAAVATANVFMMAFGPDLEPSKKNELTGQSDLETLRDAYAQFFIESGIDHVPPFLGLAIALSTYAGPKMMKETALSRAKILVLKTADGVRGLWRKFKAWRSPQNPSV